MAAIRNQTAPSRGLHSPEHEHDACGVAMVADLTGRREHGDRPQGAHRAAAPRAPRRPRQRDQHRRRCRHPPAGPRRVLPGRRRVRAARRPARTRWATRSCRSTAPAADEAVAEIDRLAAEEGLRVLGWRELPVDPEGATSAPRHAPRCPASASCSSRPPRRTAPTGIELERRTFCLRKRAEHAHRRLLPQPVAAHPRLQGHARRAAAGGVLPRPRRRARDQRAGPGALAVLHQHVPGVAARPPLPLRRAQRRDQHPARQPELDGRPRGAAGVGRCIPATSRACTRSSPRTRATRRRSTRCWSCCTSAGAACRTRC